MFVVSLPPVVRVSSSKQVRSDAAIMELIQSFHRFPPMKFTEVVPNTFFTLRTFSDSEAGEVPGCQRSEYTFGHR